MLSRQRILAFVLVLGGTLGCPGFQEVATAVAPALKPMRPLPGVSQRAVPAAAAWYVDPQKGDDHHTGSRDRPWRTINHDWTRECGIERVRNQRYGPSVTSFASRRVTTVSVRLCPSRRKVQISKTVPHKPRTAPNQRSHTGNGSRAHAMRAGSHK